MDSSVFREINLPPPAFRPQLADTLTECDANVPGHPYYGGDNKKVVSTL